MDMEIRVLFTETLAFRVERSVSFRTAEAATCQYLDRNQMGKTRRVVWANKIRDRRLPGPSGDPALFSGRL